MSRVSTSATKIGSTDVALGFLTGLVSLDFGLMTVSSCLLIWLSRAGPFRSDLAHVVRVLAFRASQVTAQQPRLDPSQIQ